MNKQKSNNHSVVPCPGEPPLLMVTIKSLLVSTSVYSSGKLNVQEYHRLFQLLTSNMTLLDSCLAKIQWSGEKSEFCCLEFGSLIIFYQFICTQIYKFMCKVPDMLQRPQKSETWSLWVASTDTQLGSYFVYLFCSCGLFSSRDPSQN